MAETGSIGDVGATFIRGVKGEEFTQWSTELAESVPSGIGIRLRSPEQSQHKWRPALGLIRKNEVKGRVALANLSAQKVVAHVLESNFVLRTPQVGTAGLEFDRATLKTIRSGVSFIKLYSDEDERPEDERDLILDSMDSLVSGHSTEWPHYLPDATLISSDPEVPVSTMEHLLEVVQGILPVRGELEAVHGTPNPYKLS